MENYVRARGRGAKSMGKQLSPLPKMNRSPYPATPRHDRHFFSPVIPSNPPFTIAAMADQPPRPTPNSPEVIAFATRMYEAARTGDLATFRQALPAGLPPNMTNDKGDSLLMLSTYHGHADLSRLLLSHGADPDRLNDRGQSPLAGAVFKNETEVVDILLEAGADVDKGQPSAWEAVQLFKKEEVYGGKFEEQRERMRGKGGTGGGGGLGGMKAGTQMT